MAIMENSCSAILSNKSLCKTLSSTLFDLAFSLSRSITFTLISEELTWAPLFAAEMLINPFPAPSSKNELPVTSFFIIAINPPYYPKTPRNEFEQAWYCGENFEYFEKLFLQLPKYHDVKSEVLMVLSEECDLSRIKNIAATNNYDLILKEKKRIYWEMNYIFEIRRA